MKLSLSRVFFTPLLHLGPVLAPENLDNSLFLKTKVVEFPNVLKHKVCTITSEHLGEVEGLEILAQLG